MDYESEITTVDIYDQVVTVETIKHNGHIVFRCGDVKRTYIDYTFDEARSNFSDVLRSQGLI